MRQMQKLLLFPIFFFTSFPFSFAPIQSLIQKILLSIYRVHSLGCKILMVTRSTGACPPAAEQGRRCLHQWTDSHESLHTPKKRGATAVTPPWEQGRQTAQAAGRSRLRKEPETQTAEQDLSFSPWAGHRAAASAREGAGFEGRRSEVRVTFYSD